MTSTYVRPVTLTPEQENACCLFEALREGRILDDIPPDACGAYASVLHDLQTTLQTRGQEAVQYQLQVAIRTDDQLALLLNSYRRDVRDQGAQEQGSETEPFASAWGNPRPLVDCEVDDFPAHALPDWLWTYTSGVAMELELDPGVVALLSLPVLATIFQRRYKVVLTDGHAPWTESLSVWALFTAEPGERKSPAIKAVIFPLQAYQSEYNQRLASAYRQAAQAQKGEDQDAADDTVLVEPQPLALALTDTTQEALVATLQDQHERAGIFASEGNSLFTVHLDGVYRKGQGDVSVLNAAWSGDSIDVSRRKDRQRIVLQEPAVSMGVCVQPGILSGISNQSNVARASGFLSRWLYCVPNSKLGQRTHNPPASNPVARDRYAAKIRALLNDAFPMQYPPPAPTIRTISLSRNAFQAIRAYQREVEPRLGNTHTLAIYRDWYAKAPGQVVRIAALLALVAGRELVEEHDIAHSKAIVEWSATHMHRTYNITGGIDIALAQRALAWLHKKDTREITRPHLSRGLRIAAQDAQNVIYTLQEYGYMRETVSPSKQPVYEVNRNVPAYAPMRGTGDHETIGES
jgi:hypothetical protein